MGAGGIVRQLSGFRGPGSVGGRAKRLRSTMATAYLRASRLRHGRARFMEYVLPQLKGCP